MKWKKISYTDIYNVEHYEEVISKLLEDYTDVHQISRMSGLHNVEATRLIIQKIEESQG